MQNEPVVPMGVQDIAPASVARLEHALVELLACFGQSTKSLRDSVIQNEADGFISHEIIIPGMSIDGMRLRFDNSRPLKKGVCIGVKERNPAPPQPTA